MTAWTDHPKGSLISDYERRRTPRELALLAELTPHARAHALDVLARASSVTLTAARGTPVGPRPPARCGESTDREGRAITLVGSLAALQEVARLVWALRVGRLCSGPQVVELERSGLPGQQLRIEW